MNNIDELVVKTLRVLSIEEVQKANSGHPGLPLGAAPMAETLWGTIMKHNPLNPKWVDRDRFVLSAGHGSSLIYALLHVFGYNLSIEDLKNFRQLDSKTPGHPEYGHTEGIEITTGPLGQGIANAVGMAMAEAYLGAKFNKEGYNIVDHYTYAIAGDGCMMEGIASEAASLAGTLGLNKLVVLYDSNNISIEGHTDIAFRENVGKRYEAYGWNVITVDNGNDLEAIEKAIVKAKGQNDKPTLVIVKTTIGYGSPAQGSEKAHGAPLGAEGIKTTKKAFEWNYEEEFYVPEEVKAYREEFKKKGEALEEHWNELFNKYKKAYSKDAEAFEKWQSGELGIEAKDMEDLWNFEKDIATRSASGTIINKLAKIMPNLIGGSADLAPSNNTNMKGEGDFSKESRDGRNLHFGVREHAMAAIANGIAVHGGLRTFVATFFVFSDYMKNSMRLSALMNLPVTYVLTHDSIGVGEDGPTHQPIEQLVGLRSIPNFTVFRPAEARETAAAWTYALEHKDGPTALVLSRQNLPLLKEVSKEALKGAYILKGKEEETPDIILMASGSEVQLIYDAEKVLTNKGYKVRVISMPSWEVFERQGEDYKNRILPKNVRCRVAVEAASSMGWHKYVGLDGEVISLDTFGASAPGELLFEKFGFTVDNVVEKALKLLSDK